MIRLELRLQSWKLSQPSVDEGIDVSVRVRTYSRLTEEALQLLGKQIRLARKQRRMTEAGLATRVGLARSTLQQIEKGDPHVEIGSVFEAATLSGVNLFVPRAPGPATLGLQIARIDDRLTLLPQSVRQPRGNVKD